MMLSLSSHGDSWSLLNTVSFFFSSCGSHTDACLTAQAGVVYGSGFTWTSVPWVASGEVQDLRHGTHNGQKMSLSIPFLPSSHRVSLFLASCLVDSVHGEAIKATSNSRLLSPEIRGCLLQVVVTKNPRGDSD